MARFRITYFCYCAFIGAFSTQWVLHLKQNLGFSDATVGLLSAAFLCSIIVANFTVSRMADAFQWRRGLQRTLSLLAVGVSFLWPLAHETWQVLLVLLAQSWCCHVQISMLDAAIVDTLGKNRERYGAVRAFGTMGYAAAAWANANFRQDNPEITFTLMQVSLGAFHIATWLLPLTQAPAAEKRPRLAWSTVRSNRPLLVLLGSSFLYSCAFASYEVFGAVYFRESGLSDSRIGALYLISSGAEIAVFFMVPLLLRHMRARDALALSMLVCAVRWACMAHCTDALGFGLLQLSHAVCFGLWYSAAIHILGRLVDAEVRTSGQALFSISFSAGFGAGGALCGFLRERWSAEAALHVSAVMAAVAGCVVLYMRRVFDDTILSGDPRHVGAHGENPHK